MTSSPTPAVLPDARAREVLAHDADCYFEWTDPRCKCVATLPASEAAVPADEVDWGTPAIAWLRARANVRPPDSLWHAAAILADRLEDAIDDPQHAETGKLAEAPKVASDTGAGLIRLAALEEAAMIAQTYGVPGGHVADTAREVAKAIRRRAALATPTDATDGATGGGEVRESDGTAFGEVQCHCSEDDGIPDVGVSLGLGNGKALWIGETLLRDGANCGMVFHDGSRRIVAPFPDRTDWQEAADILRHHVGPALTAATTPGGDLLEQAAREKVEWLFDQAFADGVAVGKSGDDSILAGSSSAYAQAAIRALKPAGDGGEA